MTTTALPPARERSRRRFRPRPGRGATALAVAAASALALTGTVGATDARAAGHQQPARLFVPPANPGAAVQIAALRAAGRTADAARVRAMVRTPQAVWVNGGTTDAQTRTKVSQVVRRAAAAKAIPTLVLYNIPFRDCAQYSSGGASTGAEYASWIRAVAAGIGTGRAIVLLEPDGLGIIPWYTPIGQGAPEWCRPTVNGSPAPGADPRSRFRQLNDAVRVLSALPGVTLYLDGTHAGWLGVGDQTDRLLKAGVSRADGFFVNVSNYQFTVNSRFYGRWVSACLAYATRVAGPSAVTGCPDHYGNAVGAGGAKGPELDRTQVWSPTAAAPDRNTSAVTARYASLLGTVEPTTRFVIDTSRNGQGPWKPAAGRYPDPQDWCNPPGRGTGARPTTATGDRLVAALLWIKIPGESDGECTRGVPGATTDPEWGGTADPAAGRWFDRMALQLARNGVRR